MCPESRDESAIYFVTKVIYHRVPIFAMDEKYSLIVIENLKFYRKKFKFGLYGFVIMPEHYHYVIDTFNRVTISKIKEDMNKYISRQIILDLKTNRPEMLAKFAIDVHYRKGHRPHHYQLFQKGRYDFEIWSVTKLLEKLGYMHKNPVRGGLANRMEDYAFSSARNYIRNDESLIRLDPLPV